ncbi:putative short-chain dehydrogenase [Seiridium cupressi]
MGKIGGIATQFWPPRPGFTEVNISRASQAGKVFMVTGGNSGLGYELVLPPSGLPLTNRAGGEKLDTLWNNGGIGANAFQYGDRTEQDLEILTAAPVQGTPSRVAWLTTILVDTSAAKNGVEFPSVDTSFGARMENYAASKAGVWVLRREFAKRHKVDGIISVALNPGSLETGSFGGTPRITMFLMR